MNIQHRQRKIITHCICPPIPDRRWDWVAYFDGEEEKQNNGYGPTEESAVVDLIENYGDEHDRTV